LRDLHFVSFLPEAMNRKNIHERPVLALPRSLGHMLLDGVALGLFGFLCITIITHWSDLPDTIPMHFGFGGKPDSEGNKELVLLFPLFAACALIAFSFMRRIPHRLNYIIPITAENAERQYRNALHMIEWIKVELTGIFSFLGWSVVWMGIDRLKHIDPPILPVMLAVVIGTVVIFVVRSYRLH
jgi:Domain of unknown function (DUF1648)